MVEELAEKKLVDKMTFEHWLWLLMTGMLTIEFAFEGPVFGTYPGDMIIMMYFGALWFVARRHDHEHLENAIKFRAYNETEQYWRGRHYERREDGSTSPGETPGDIAPPAVDSWTHGDWDPKRTSE